MTQVITTAKPALDLDRAMIPFFAIVALVLLVFGIRYWLLMLGVWEPDLKFDTLPVHWRVAAASMAVLQPVAAVGLWGRLDWGIAVWIIVIISEMAMYSLMTDRFGEANYLVAFHMVSLGIWICYKAAKWVSNRRRIALQQR